MCCVQDAPARKAKYAARTPMTKEPMTFTANVPQGNCGPNNRAHKTFIPCRPTEPIPPPKNTSAVASIRLPLLISGYLYRSLLISPAALKRRRESPALPPRPSPTAG